jgi:hypothetical protein
VLPPRVFLKWPSSVISFCAKTRYSRRVEGSLDIATVSCHSSPHATTMD